MPNEIQPRLFHALIENFEKKIASLPHLKVSHTIHKTYFCFSRNAKKIF